MKSTIPDYFLALVKQHANLVNDEQTTRYVLGVSTALDATLNPNQASMFFSSVPAYLRPGSKKFFSKLGDWQHKPKTHDVLRSIASSLSLTDQGEAKVVLAAYFAAIKVVIDPSLQLKLVRTLPVDVARLYQNV